ncbi:MAG: hypothetical protein HC795_01520 [Coleofasciculaceae cyanobacterium RL_1_1]|nr:hypothetical protein [Coleofasciculaceae cyanobacterium RL_1_1]
MSSQTQNPTNESKPASLEQISQDTRATLEQEAKAKLDLIEARLEEVKAKANTAKAEAKAECLKTASELEAQRDRAIEYFQGLQAAGDDAWKDLHSSFEAAFGELRSGVDRAIEHFKSAAS